MTEFAKKYGYNRYSQNGEDGIIEEVIKRIRPKDGDPFLPRYTACEFGAADGKYCSNIYNLSNSFAAGSHGWNFYCFESNRELYQKLLEDDYTKTWCKNLFVTEDNINIVVPEKRENALMILSIDIDGNDYEVWKAYTGKPSIVIIEINSSLNPDIWLFSKESGASFKAMNELAESKGYFLLCHTGNCIYVLNEYKDLFPDADKQFNKSWL